MDNQNKIINSEDRTEIIHIEGNDKPLGERLNEALMQEEVAGEPEMSFQNASVDIGHEKLLICLYFLWDAFQHGMMDMFLVKDTAKDAIKDMLLHGDKVTVGVRRNEWESNWGLLKIFLENERIAYNFDDKEGILKGEYQEVPFVIHLYTENICLEALNPITYQYETFYVPNMFEKFESEFDK